MQGKVWAGKRTKHVESFVNKVESFTREKTIRRFEIKRISKNQRLRKIKDVKSVAHQYKACKEEPLVVK